MTSVDTTSTAPLTGIGVSILLVFGAEIRPPRNDENGVLVRPGIDPVVHADGSVVLYPRGYSNLHAAAQAVSEAGDVCRLAGLEVTMGPEPRTRTVRRKEAAVLHA